jgi:hypothetical protein
MGIVILLVGFVLIAWAWRVRDIAELKRTGHRVIAQVTNISREFGFNLRYSEPSWSGGRRVGDWDGRAWYVEADWTDPKTGIPYRFKKGPLYRHQAKLYAIGELISVLVDPTDPNHYYVESAH